MAVEKLPFVFGQLAGKPEFTDRAEEKERLVLNFISSLNTILISPRRWGKSSLVAQAANSAKRKDKRIRVCFIDLFNVRDEEQFYKELAVEVINQSANKWEEKMKMVKDFFKKIVPVISYSPMPGQDFSLKMDWEEVKRNPGEILDLPERVAKNRKLKMVVCIDEFQNIGNFDDPSALQKRMRSHWQKHQQVSYCLYGSKRQMMMDVFASVQMPFYKFGDIIFLEKINEKDWIKFIVKRFRDTGKIISKELAARVARHAENHPYYVQQLAQLTWLRTENESHKEIVDAALDSLLHQLSLLFQNITDSLTKSQVNFLKALLEGVESFSAKRNLKKYDYGTSGNIKRIKESLLNKEIIDIRGSEINMLDPMYKHWLKRYYFI